MYRSNPEAFATPTVAPHSPMVVTSQAIPLKLSAIPVRRSRRAWSTFADTAGDKGGSANDGTVAQMTTNAAIARTIPRAL